MAAWLQQSGWAADHLTRRTSTMRSRTLPRTSLIAAATLVCAVALPASALAGDFMVRGRVLQLDPSNDSATLAGNVDINSRAIWEVDASYFFCPNLAVELIATTPVKQNVSLDGSKLGTLRHLPPTLTVQYHFMPESTLVRPYAGVGVNYTHFSAVNLAPGLDVDRNSWGLALQVGADFPITKQVYLNVDLKKIDIRTSVYSNGTNLGLVKVDPLLFGLGVGYRF
jgi:outer membrane protein